MTDATGLSGCARTVLYGLCMRSVSGRAPGECVECDGDWRKGRCRRRHRPYRHTAKYWQRVESDSIASGAQLLAVVSPGAPTAAMSREVLSVELRPCVGGGGRRAGGSCGEP